MQTASDATPLPNSQPACTVQALLRTGKPIYLGTADEKTVIERLAITAFPHLPDLESTWEDVRSEKVGSPARHVT